MMCSEKGGIRHREPEFQKLFQAESGQTFALFAFPNEHRIEVWECDTEEEAMELLEEFREMTITIH